MTNLKINIAFFRTYKSQLQPDFYSFSLSFIRLNYTKNNDTFGILEMFIITHRRPIYHFSLRFLREHGIYEATLFLLNNMLLIQNLCYRFCHILSDFENISCVFFCLVSRTSSSRRSGIYLRVNA